MHGEGTNTHICHANGCHVLLAVAKHISVAGNVQLCTLSGGCKTARECEIGRG